MLKTLRLKDPATFLAYFFAYLAIALIVLVMLIGPVQADPATPAAPVSVDFSPILTQLLEVLGAVLAGLGSWVLTRLAARYKIQIDDSTRAYVNDGLYKAINYAQNMAAEKLKPISVTTFSNPALGHAVDFMLQHFPDAVTALGGQAAIERMLLARLPATDGPVTQVPAT